MQRILTISLFLFTCLFAAAQDENDITEEKTSGFNPNHLFIGSSLMLGFSSGSFSAGANPEIGYSLTNWLDAGLGFNINYYSISGEYNYGVQQNSFNYGGGPFMRVYPIPFLFLHGQYEYNWVNYNLNDQVNGNSSKYTTSSSSILVGLGYAQRIVGQSNFYTILMMDLGNDIYSPYTDSYGSPYPFIRAGFSFYLGRSNQRR